MFLCTGIEYDDGILVGIIPFHRQLGMFSLVAINHIDINKSFAPPCVFSYGGCYPYKYVQCNKHYIGEWSSSRNFEVATIHFDVER